MPGFADNIQRIFLLPPVDIDLLQRYLSDAAREEDEKNCVLHIIAYREHQMMGDREQ